VTDGMTAIETCSWLSCSWIQGYLDLLKIRRCSIT